jgi:hypothetical protein
VRRRRHADEESETHERTLWVAGVTSLPDAERDAADVVQALAGLASLLRRSVSVSDAAELRTADLEDVRRVLLNLAEDGGAAAARVLAYLRALQGAGDGDFASVPPRLGPWRDWAPSRGHVFGGLGHVPRIGELPNPRRSDPGE